MVRNKNFAQSLNSAYYFWYNKVMNLLMEELRFEKYK